MHDESDDVSRLGRFSWFDLFPSVELVVIVLVTAVLIWAWVPPARGADFEVVNRLPPTFTVVNRVQPAPAGKASGVVLPHSPVSTPAPVLLGWNVTFSDGSVRFVPVVPQVMPAPGVPVQQPFRGGYFPASHRCPECNHLSRPRTGNWLVQGWNADGTHNHRCEKCGYVGRH